MRILTDEELRQIVDEHFDDIGSWSVNDLEWKYAELQDSRKNVERSWNTWRSITK